MIVSFKDGTRLTLPDGRESHNFLQFDLPWLVYVHGEVTCMKKQSVHTSFSVRLPGTDRRKDCRC